MRPKILDLFCKAGGTGMGYHMAGFRPVGVDIEPQPNYPFAFREGSALDIDVDKVRRNFDAVHASPPCQAYSSGRHLWKDREHPDLVEPTRELLEEIGLPYVIENVPGAPLIEPTVLCGSSFGLRVRRHRLFETNWDLAGVPCEHHWQDRHKCYLVREYHGGERRMRATGVLGVWGHGECAVFSDGSRDGTEFELWRVAMGIDWMTREELAQAIPPAYTRYIGKQLLEVI